MTRAILPHEVDELVARLPRWLPVALGWSVRLAHTDPTWLPGAVRRCPLRGCAMVVRLYARRTPHDV